MKIEEMMAYVDHTSLKATTTWEDIKRLCRESMEYKTASVCIQPCYVEKVKQEFGSGVNICTVIGFPLGCNTLETKVFEAGDAIAKGASEIDMVISIADVKSGRCDRVEKEIGAVKEVVGDRILKVIIEACYLSVEEKIAMCRAVTGAGADYIKTSTGFGTGGAVLEDILLFQRHIGGKVRIKAAGGIKSLEELEAFIKAGCSRIGTSSAVDCAKGLMGWENY